MPEMWLPCPAVDDAGNHQMRSLIMGALSETPTLKPLVSTRPSPLQVIQLFYLEER